MRSHGPDRAVVVSATSHRAVLLVEGGRFVTVRVRHLTVGQEIAYPVVSVRVPAWRWAGAAAAAVAVGYLALGQTILPAYAQTTAYVSVELNPGFTLGVSSTGQITSVTPEDKDAQALAVHLSLIGQPLSTAVPDIIQAAISQHQILPNTPLAFMVTAYQAHSAPISSSLKKEITVAETEGRSLLTKSGVSPVGQAVVVTPSLVATARKDHLGVGAYVLYLELKKSGKPVSLHDFEGPGITKALSKLGALTTLDELLNAPPTQDSQGSQGAPEGIIQLQPSPQENQSQGQGDNSSGSSSQNGNKGQGDQHSQNGSGDSNSPSGQTGGTPSDHGSNGKNESGTQGSHGNRGDSGNWSLGSTSGQGDGSGWAPWVLKIGTGSSGDHGSSSNPGSSGSQKDTSQSGQSGGSSQDGSGLALPGGSVILPPVLPSSNGSTSSTPGGDSQGGDN